MGIQVDVRITDSAKKPDLYDVFLRRDHTRTARYTMTVEPSEYPMDLSMGNVTIAKLVYILVKQYDTTSTTENVSIARDGSIDRIIVGNSLLLIDTSIETLDVLAPQGAILEVFIGGE
jgi:hypothetical protein